MKIFILLAVLALSFAAAKAGTSRPQLLRLHQVTRAEYNELLRLTQGEKEVPEARLLSSPIAGIKGLAAGVKSGFAAGSFIPSLFSSTEPPKKVVNKKGYPLCVISATNVDVNEDDDDENDGKDAGKSLTFTYEPNSDSSSGSGSGSGSGHGSGSGSGSGSSIDVDDTTTVNCILQRYLDYEEERSLEDASDAIDAYNSYYYQQTPVTTHRKRSRAHKQVVPNSGYQPASYPKQEYASNYPKVVRNYGLTDPAPVYVKSPQYEQ
ncbi:uncharacterized protein Dwil_GK23317 [Drosophila willistoni]|uniref:DUF4794 domain-containing protein n=1 Tax=Drosophila willistoni TaxID=7260 RepID=B4NNH8_DROWI|nr:uncharacterized protein Dwil_GK23317 [Drosophila willistoni]